MFLQIESTGVSLRAREPAHRFFRHRPDRGELRLVHIHVCQTGGNWERDHLLFRDYLRTHLEQAAAYLTLKRNLATRFGDDRIAYTDGKDVFVAETLQLAEEWAQRTGWDP